MARGGNAGLHRVRDRQGWLIDLEVFDITMTSVTLGKVEVIHDVPFELPLIGAQVSLTHEENEVVDGYFYIANLDSGLRFSLLEFVIRVLANYGISAGAQFLAHLNHLLHRLYNGPSRPNIRIFRLFYRLKKRE